jgi:DUF917 family protein
MLTVDWLGLPNFSMSSSEEVRDFVRGCTFYGTGGGGSPEYGLEIMNRVLKEKGVVRVVDVAKVKDDAWTCSAYGMGSIAPRTPKILDEMKRMGFTKPSVEYKLEEAIKELERYTQTKVSVIVPAEIGGANTPDPVATANHAGFLVVDGDYAGGRAMPAAVNAMPHFQGNLMVPLVSVDEWGNTVILQKALNNASAEKIGKLVAVLAYGNLAGNATWLFRGSKMKTMITPGTLSKAFKTGKKIRELREKNKDLAELAAALHGFYLFKGRVVSKDEENRDQEYYWGSYTMEGTDEFRNHTFKVWFQNENHMSWLDGDPYVMTPDFITSLEVKHMEPIINPKIKAGDELAIFGFSAVAANRTERALRWISPKNFGFDVRYVPVEQKLRARKSR